MMNERLQAKYMTVLEDMYVSGNFKLNDIRVKHKVDTRLFAAAKTAGFIVKRRNGYTWESGAPTKRHLNRIKVELMTLQLKKSSKRQPSKKTIVKLFWGLISYEK